MKYMFRFHELRRGGYGLIRTPTKVPNSIILELDVSKIYHIYIDPEYLESNDSELYTLSLKPLNMDTDYYSYFTLRYNPVYKEWVCFENTI